jgi:hypothetical protein
LPTGWPLQTSMWRNRDRVQAALGLQEASSKNGVAQVTPRRLRSLRTAVTRVDGLRFRLFRHALDPWLAEPHFFIRRAVLVCLSLLAGDSVLVAVEIIVVPHRSPVDQRAAQERGHRRTGSLVSGTSSSDAVWISPVEVGAVLVQARRQGICARRTALGGANDTRARRCGKDDESRGDQGEPQDGAQHFPLLETMLTASRVSHRAARSPRGQAVTLRALHPLCSGVMLRCEGVR